MIWIWPTTSVHILYPHAVIILNSVKRSHHFSILAATMITGLPWPSSVRRIDAPKLVDRDWRRDEHRLRAWYRAIYLRRHCLWWRQTGRGEKYGSQWLLVAKNFCGGFLLFYLATESHTCSLILIRNKAIVRFRVKRRVTCVARFRGRVRVWFRVKVKF